MIIRKTQQPSDFPTNSISNAKTTGTTNTYSCDYINGIIESGAMIMAIGLNMRMEL